MLTHIVKKYLNKHSFKFKNEHTLEQRLEEYQRVINKYADRIPVIIEQFPNFYEKCFFSLEKNKYLIPIDFTIGQFMFLIRKQMKVDSLYVIYLLINDTIPSVSSSFGNLHKQYLDAEDGFLYIVMKNELTLG
jgi:GABA(A) receptor-associated protein